MLRVVVQQRRSSRRPTASVLVLLVLQRALQDGGHGRGALGRDDEILQRGAHRRQDPLEGREDHIVVAVLNARQTLWRDPGPFGELLPAEVPALAQLPGPSPDLASLLLGGGDEMRAVLAIGEGTEARPGNLDPTVS